MSYNPNFIIYNNGRIYVAGAIGELRIKGLAGGSKTEQNIQPAHKAVRVYDCRTQHGDNQPYVDFEMPAYIGGPSEWTTNPELAVAISEGLSKNMKITLFAACLKLVGLSHEEAAQYLGSRKDTVSSWANGRRQVPDGIWDDLRALYSMQAEAGDGSGRHGARCR